MTLNHIRWPLDITRIKSRAFKSRLFSQFQRYILLLCSIAIFFSFLSDSIDHSLRPVVANHDFEPRSRPISQGLSCWRLITVTAVSFRYIVSRVGSGSGFIHILFNVTERKTYAVYRIRVRIVYRFLYIFFSFSIRVNVISINVSWGPEKIPSYTFFSKIFTDKFY